jgi:lycopene cyclase domain-containing protein
LYTYLLINLAAVLVPLAFSFEKKDIYFFGKWKFLFPSILLTMLLFIPWDVAFTSMGVWGFNPRYLSGIYLFGLPLGEWMFFITVPFACIFTYEVVRKHVKRDILKPYATTITWVLALFFLLVGLLNTGKWYTGLTFILTSAFLLLHLLVLRSNYLSWFLLSYLIILIPFTIVNGMLTGTGLAEPIVWYNDAENLSIRYFTIPVEDSVYGLLLILMNLTWYEFLKNRKAGQETG